jgi:hypothetical protein
LLTLCTHTIQDDNDVLQEVAQYQIFITLFIALLIRLNAFPQYKVVLDIVLVIVNISTSFLTIAFVCKFYDRLKVVLSGGEESERNKMVRLMTENRELKASQRRHREEMLLVVRENERLRNDLSGHIATARDEAFSREMEVFKDDCSSSSEDTYRGPGLSLFSIAGSDEKRHFRI